MFNSNLNGIIGILLIISIGYFLLKLWHSFIWKKKKFQLSSINQIGNKRWLLLVLIILFIALLFYMDFIRDYVFKNLNYRMQFLESIEKGGSTDKYQDYTDTLVQNLTPDATSYSIYRIKFLATGIFVLIYFLLSQIILKLIYNKEYLLPYTSLFYLLGFLSMCLVFCGYFFTFTHDVKLNFYLISMEIGHFLESSLPTLLMIVGFKIYTNYQLENPTE